ncbi:uncharacterized protein LOC118408849 [Branchiostoma floridae]|uniref:Uncharacterized protein LOC118405383 n=1 Tax=Branchiostoma floridae TaxID=7739 RepID=A0A9J7HJN8_BRAFL|nr:uncharacterized protein LOC118405383 [Branchiostoma floridae]XP_035665600.1 uncharacterized protein LOC118408849 [Branchiostoma floridae]
METPSEMSGYVHNVSPMKDGAKSKFFRFDFQTSEDESRKGICFSPQKRSFFCEKEQSSSPCKISKVSSCSMRSSDFVVNEKSSVESTADVGFPAKRPSIRSVSVKDISYLSVNDVVRVNVKVLSIDKTEKVTVNSGDEREKTDVIVGDTSGAVRLCVWQPHVLELGRSYGVDAKVKLFARRRFLSTFPESVVNEVGPIYAPDGIQQIDQVRATGTIIGSQVLSRFYKCNSCKRKIDPTETKFLCCPHCNMKQLRERSKEEMIVKVVVDDHGKHVHLTCFSSIVSTIIGEDSLAMKSDDVEEKLLEQEEVELMYDAFSNTVNSVGD